MRIALLIAFALTGCIPPQPQPANGAPPPMPAPAAASCADTLSCYSQCNPLTDACVGSCDQRTTADPQQNAHAVLQCMVQSGCKDQNCVAQQCGAQITTCTNLAMPTTAQASAPAPAPSSGADQTMTPEYSYGSLVIPPPRRNLTQADLAGEWDSGSGTGTSYYDSGGSYTGSTTISTATHWNIDAQGNLVEQWRGATSTSGAAMAHGMSEDSTGTIIIANNNTVTMTKNPNHYHKDPEVEYYIVVGWFVGPSEITMTLHGPLYNPITQKDFDDAQRNSYMDEKYHRKR